MDKNQHNTEKNFHVVLNIAARMIQSQADRPLTSDQAWKNDAQALAIKLLKQACSVHLLFNTDEFVSDDGEKFYFVDFSSTTILTRACIETYIVFHWVFQSPDLGLKKFRHSLWKLGGLIDRLALHPSTPESKEKMHVTAQDVSHLQAELEASPHIHTYTAKQIKQLLKGNWRTSWSWVDEGVRAGLPKQFLENIYSHFCGIAHSSYISSMQTAQAKDINVQKTLAETSLQICTLIISRFILLYADFFPEAKSVIENVSSEKLQIIELYNFDTADMDKLYDNKNKT